MRYLIFILTFLSFTLNAQITSAWTTELSTRLIPAGASNPTVAALDNPATKLFYIELDGATYDNANAATGFNAVCNAVKTEIDSNWVQDSLKLDTAFNVTIRIVITQIKREFDSFESTEPAKIYLTATDRFKIWGRLEYE